MSNAEAINVANDIDRLRGYYVVASSGLFLAGHPQQDAILDFMHLGDFASINVGRADGSYHHIPDARDLLRSHSGPGFNLDYLGGILSLMILWIGEDLKQESWFDRSPALEFFRHVRNAVAHNNAFHFLGGEPRRPARFRNFQLDAGMHGQNLFFEFMMAGDVLDLFVDIAAHLRESA